jgi:hypothetical protein
VQEMYSVPSFRPTLYPTTYAYQQLGTVKSISAVYYLRIKFGAIAKIRSNLMSSTNRRNRSASDNKSSRYISPFFCWPLLKDLLLFITSYGIVDNSDCHKDKYSLIASCCMYTTRTAYRLR